MTDSGYDELRDRLAAALERAIEAQTAGRRAQIDGGFDNMDAALPRIQDPRFVKLLIALGFWEGWIDSSNHDWRFYEPLSEKDWPALASQVAADLRADREMQSPAVLEQFDWRLRKDTPSIWNRLKKVLRVG